MKTKVFRKRTEDIVIFIFLMIHKDNKEISYTFGSLPHRVNLQEKYPVTCEGLLSKAQMYADLHNLKIKTL